MKMDFILVKNSSKSMKPSISGSSGPQLGLVGPYSLFAFVTGPVSDINKEIFCRCTMKYDIWLQVNHDMYASFCPRKLSRTMTKLGKVSYYTIEFLKQLCLPQLNVLLPFFFLPCLSLSLDSLSLSCPLVSWQVVHNCFLSFVLYHDTVTSCCVH